MTLWRLTARQRGDRRSILATEFGWTSCAWPIEQCVFQAPQDDVFTCGTDALDTDPQCTADLEVGSSLV